MPDPAAYKDEWRAFEEKLKSDAKAKNAEKNKVQSQVPAGPTPGARPGQAPSRPAASAQRLPVTPGNRDDATPPPTRNPLLAKRPAQPESARETGDEDSLQEQASVEIAADALSVEGNSTQIKENPLNRPKPPSSGARPPVKPPPPRR
jgi:hypothetical protein